MTKNAIFDFLRNHQGYVETKRFCYGNGRKKAYIKWNRLKFYSLVYINIEIPK